MLKQQARLLTRIAIILDLAVVALSFIAAHAIRSSFAGEVQPLRSYLWFLLFILPSWFFCSRYFDLYQSHRVKKISKVLAQLLKAHFTSTVISSSVIFFVEPHMFGRKLFFLYVCISFLSLAGCKLFLSIVLHYFRRRGMNIRNILLVGSGSRLNDFISLVERHLDWGLRIIGVIGDTTISEQSVTKYPHLGQLSDLVEICKNRQVDEVVFCLPPAELTEAESHVIDLADIGVTSRMILDFIDFPASRREIFMFHETLPMLTFYCRAFDANKLFLKRILDVVGAIVGLALLGIMLPFIALFIKLDSPGPIFFGQQRVGENGRRFKCWKIRSMYIDAEDRKKELMSQNEMQGHMFKIKDDPRITRVGNFLRKSSIDEFPQFWNVLKGEMSLVGTRPPTPDEVEKYEDWHRKRICIKPGITGLWQVSGRSKIQDFDQIVRLDIQYIENWTLWLDIKLILKTFWVVFAGRGAR